jgi:hypothetical protein
MVTRYLVDTEWIIDVFNNRPDVAQTKRLPYVSLAKNRPHPGG